MACIWWEETIEPEEIPHGEGDNRIESKLTTGGLWMCEATTLPTALY